ncbi:aspartyl-phosphate phosphatase Spo0E family protein [Ammoniphilus sp. CFH 90114]|uniref:aspartyl-phosphate phosphatase Spo0E family protein n=1 Tax=Ammoniphilus sp. CFH 90114 TaxID=2493665 RepID=UPI00100FF7C3|nr:aspartyl-phosphate phosphatase Spo0E family protein [Ammoniphilus sp. CFH 90114]
MTMILYKLVYLLRKIEKEKEHLNKLVVKKGISSHDVLTASQELDKIIVAYQKTLVTISRY